MRNRTAGRQVAICGWMLLLGFELLFLCYIAVTLHWHGPVQDFWGSIPFLEKSLQSGHWFGADLWVAQNNHRLALPRLAFLLDYRFFAGSNHFLIGLSFLSLAIMLGIFWRLSERRKSIFLISAVFLSSPALAYNFLNTFNVQWILCSALALAACAAFAAGLAQRRRIWVLSGIICALLCSFTTFSLTALWPALFLLLWLQRSHLRAWFSLLMLALLFSGAFLFLLPVHAGFGSGSMYEIPSALHALIESPLVVSAGLLLYVLHYLALPAPEAVQGLMIALVAISFGWWGYRLWHRPSIDSWAVHTLLAAMMFAICLAFTTGLGRVFMGDLSQGVRFYPIVALYWASFLGAFMRLLPDRFLAALFMLAVLTVWALSSACRIEKRLVEEHNRFGRMQMAYLANNLQPSALYENFVPEWRTSSYPGIVAAVPILKERKLGVFNDPIAGVARHLSAAELPIEAACPSLRAQEKPRNQDPEVRNLFFSSEDPRAIYQYPYVLVYRGERLIGAAFRERLPRLSSWAANTVGDRWIGTGLAMMPAVGETVVVAVDRQHQPCRAVVQF